MNNCRVTVASNCPEDSTNMNFLPRKGTPRGSAINYPPLSLFEGILDPEKSQGDPRMWSNPYPHPWAKYRFSWKCASDTATELRGSRRHTRTLDPYFPPFIAIPAKTCRSVLLSSLFRGHLTQKYDAKSREWSINIEAPKHCPIELFLVLGFRKSSAFKRGHWKIR